MEGHERQSHSRPSTAGPAAKHLQRRAHLAAWAGVALQRAPGCSVRAAHPEARWHLNACWLWQRLGQARTSLPYASACRTANDTISHRQRQLTRKCRHRTPWRAGAGGPRRAAPRARWPSLCGCPSAQLNVQCMLMTVAPGSSGGQSFATEAAMPVNSNTHCAEWAARLRTVGMSIIAGTPLTCSR